MRAAIAILALLCGASLAAAQSVDKIDVVGAVRGGGVFNGNLKITKFLRQKNVLAVGGVLTGTITKADGTLVGEVNSVLGPVSGGGRKLLQTLPALPITGITGTCDILNLDIGAINLNLLGLIVDLSPINLDIVAQSGAGNLLGNLLCAVANLLNGGLNLNALVIQLNNLLNALLGGLALGR